MAPAEDHACNVNSMEGIEIATVRANRMSFDYRHRLVATTLVCVALGSALVALAGIYFGWLVCTASTPSELIACLTQLGGSIVLVSLLSTLLMFRIARPLRLLSQLASQRTVENPALMGRGDEIGFLAREFHTLQHGVEFGKKLLAREKQTDPVTGLANRNVAHDRLNAAIKSAARTKTAIAVVIVDLRQLASINSQYGYQAGDRALSTVATRLCHGLKSSDSVCRLSGDEFMALVEHETGEDLVRVTENLARSLCKPISVQGASVRLSTSMGVSMYPEHGHTSEDLLRRSDIALRASAADTCEPSFYAHGQDEAYRRGIQIS